MDASMIMTNADAAPSIQSLPLTAPGSTKSHLSTDIKSVVIAANTGNDPKTIRADKVPCMESTTRPFRECHHAEEHAASIAGSVNLS